MQAATAANPRKRIVLLVVSLALALAAVLLFPPLAVPMSFLMPLVACPVQFSLGLWHSLLLPLAPCLGAVLTGMDLPLSLLLLPSSYFCLLLTQWASRRKFSFTSVAAMLAGLMLLAQTLWWGRVMMLLGGDLFAGLAERTVGTLSVLPNSNSLLYSLVQMGFLELPARFQQSAGLRLGSLVVLNPALRTELLNALRFQLHGLLKAGIPLLLVQSSLIIGLFTALRTTKEISKRTASSSAPLPQQEDQAPAQEPVPYPLFRIFRLPSAYRGYLFFLALMSLVLALSPGDVPALMSTLAMVAFVTVYRLLGASALVFFLCRRNPDRSFWAGFLACALYVSFPTLLFVLGLADQFMDLRTVILHHQEED